MSFLCVGDMYDPLHVLDGSIPSILQEDEATNGSFYFLKYTSRTTLASLSMMDDVAPSPSPVNME